MNISVKFRDDAAKAAMARDELYVALKEWHGDETARGVTKADFDTWLRKVIDYLADNSKDGIELTTDWMVNALKVQVGMIPSVKSVMERDRKSFDLDNADINSYIEEGVVYVSVWYKGRNAEAAAESTKDFFAANGFIAQFFGRKGGDEYTVCASRDFDGEEVK